MVRTMAASRVVDFSPSMASTSAALRRLPVSSTSKVSGSPSVKTVISTDRSASMIAASRCWPSTSTPLLSKAMPWWVTCQSPRRIASANARTVDFDNGRLLVLAASITSALSGVIFATLLRTRTPDRCQSRTTDLARPARIFTSQRGYTVLDCRCRGGRLRLFSGGLPGRGRLGEMQHSSVPHVSAAGCGLMGAGRRCDPGGVAADILVAPCAGYGFVRQSRVRSALRRGLRWWYGTVVGDDDSREGGGGLGDRRRRAVLGVLELGRRAGHHAVSGAG